MRRKPRSIKIALLIASMGFLAACSDEKAAQQATSSEPAAPARVSVLSVQPAKVVVYDELPGRVSAYRTAEIRAQVSGIIEKKLFEEGASIDAHAPLFQIDPALFIAEVDASSAVLARVEAELLNARIKFERTELLSAKQINSAEALNNAAAALAQAKANVAEAKANLARRKLELSYATIKSPIAGIIGRSFLGEGGLASSSATTPLAVVQQIDQVYVDVRQSAMSKEMLEGMASNTGDAALDLPVKILTIAGKAYDQPGKMLFSDISVDTSTGSVAIRVLVPNPAQQLLPGMYIRAKVPRAIYSQALMVPQEAVVRDPSGRPQLVVVDKDSHGSRRNVSLGALVDGQYIVLSGLEAKDNVVVLGQDRAQDGVKLETTPYMPSALDVKG
ncbi:efflux RND transporter periplasmic adaptor subunit [Rhizobium oryziradicis]|uniref:Efflux transporter periplasmic adaptor subunit n=1 Tax=Rhizobium oryziradicis TaxID=1867956 RepID=A0A1Q8ZM81_9HYPH|nr:efflux RND transporter periplasmic adaptor subunit [Rhizobium oryziradicis]OLP43006.1 efflux transporter periplasmic adaptor subunit [Rhizobium oryziradicis]